MRNLGRILLTGSQGLIGRAVAATLLEKRADVTMPVRAQVDLTDPTAVKAFFSADSFNTVLHFASRGVGADAHDESLIVDECAMIEALVPVVRPGGHFLYAGSVSEYGHSGRLSEDHPCTPQTAYGWAKLRAGLLLNELASGREISVCIARIFGAYGPDEQNNRLFPSVLSALAVREPIALSDGRQIRDFIHVSDIAAATLRLARLLRPPRYVNIGTGVGLEVRDAVRQLALHLGANPDLLLFGHRARSPHDMDELVADTTRLSRTLDWVPPQRLTEGKSVLSLL